MILSNNRQSVNNRTAGIRLLVSGCLLFSLMTVSPGAVAQDTTNTGIDSVIVVGRSTMRGVLVTGKVIDAAANKPAAGVRVQVEGYSADITDADGVFSLKAPSYDATLLVSGEGFDTRQVPLKGRNNISVSLLDESHESFYGTVAMPTGQYTRNVLTASAGQYTVNGWAQNAEVPDALLQGRIAGLNVIRRSGMQGAGANLFLRGFNSLYATNKPLIVIDNIIFDANDYGQSIIANNYTNPLALIDVKDIDNVTVVRDASSIYGTKGANGAIIITTARASGQATKIDFAVYTGFNEAPKGLPVMNAQDYRVYLSEMLQSKGMSASEINALPYMNDDPSSATYHSYHFQTDWQKKVFENSMNNNYFLKVTGGDNIATYGLSMGFMKNAGVLRATDLTRYNTRFNAEFNFSKRFTGSSNLSFAYNEQNLKDQGIADKTSPVFLALVKSPFLSDHEFNSAGIQSPNLADRDSLGISNPSAIIQQMQAYNKYYRFQGSFGFRYEISKQWSASTVIGVVYDKVRENIFGPSRGVQKDTLSNEVADNRLGTQVKRLFSIFNDTRVEYKRAFGFRHNLAARAGVRYQHNDAEQDFALGFNSATDELVSVQNGVAALRQIGGGLGKWNWLNNYLGVDYGYLNKMFLSFNMAVDGSSRFGREAKDGIGINGYRFAVMPSIAAAWLVSSEHFMAASGISLLKLRASYGLSGNDDIGNYSSRQTYVAQNLLGMQGLVRNGIANPELQWETVKKFNLGLDIAIMKDRLSLSMDAYRSNTENMLVYESLSTPTGFKNVLTNNGSMKNEGLELTVNARIVNTSAVKWDLGITAATNRNRIGSVPNDFFFTQFAGATLFTANEHTPNLFYGFVSNGVFASDAAAAATGLRVRNYDGSFTNFSGGDMRFADMNGDMVIDNNDRTIIGDPNPDFTGGISSRVGWKNFEMNMLFTFSKGNDVFNYLRYRLESGSGVENQLVSVNNRWRANGQQTAVPRITWNDPVGNSRFSDRWIEDGSYFRMRSVSLQYYIPLKNAIVNSATIYVSGNNLFTLTKYKGYDPEFSVNTSVFAQGIDTGLTPQFRNITLGARIGL